jgi:hypothetical protein
MARKTTSAASREPKPTRGSIAAAAESWRKEFLCVLVESRSVSTAIAGAGVEPATVYSARAEDAAFAADWDMAAKGLRDEVEASLSGAPNRDVERAASLLDSGLPRSQFRAEPVVDEGEQPLTLAELVRRAQEENDDADL